MKILKIAFFVCFFAFSSCTFATYTDMSLGWKTIETEHFNIHYHTAEQETADLLVVIAEDVHKSLTSKLGWAAPRCKTELVVNNNLDTLNGYAWVGPYNRIFIYAYPNLHPSNGLITHEEYLWGLVLHEYAHILQLTQIKDFPEDVRDIFGVPYPPMLLSYWLTVPENFAPLWFIEGFAVYQESRYHGKSGRGNSSAYPMHMRMEVQNGIKSLDTLNLTETNRWPLDRMYLYGYYFMEFIEHTYGEEAISKIIHELSGHIIPYNINKSIKCVTGKNIVDLWGDYKQYLLQKFGSQLQHINDNGIVQGSALQTKGGFISMVKGLPDGRIFYSGNPLYGLQSISVKTPNGQHKTIYTSKSPLEINFAVHAQRGIAFTKADRDDKDNIFYDLYIMDLNGKRVKRLSCGKRFNTVSWHRSGEYLIATQYIDNKWRLVKLSLQAEILEVLWEGKNVEHISYIDCSPTEDKVVVSIYIPYQGIRLAEYNEQTREWRFLTDGADIATDPVYSVDGKKVLFSSDHNKVFNIRELDLSTGLIKRITNVLGGAVRPYQQSNDHVYYYQYQANGYNLFEIKSPAPVAEGTTKFEAYSPAPNKEKCPNKNKKYSPWNTLKPRSWWPFLIGSEDALDVHHYSIGYQSTGLGLLVNYNYNSRLFVSGIRLQNDNRSIVTSLYIPIINSFEHRVNITPYVLLNNYVSEYGIDLVYNSSVIKIGGYGQPSFGRKIIFSANNQQSIRSSIPTSPLYYFKWNEYIPLSGTNILKLEYLRTYEKNFNQYYQDHNKQNYTYQLPLIVAAHNEIAQANWQFPLLYVDRGLNYLPIGINQFWGSLFTATTYSSTPESNGKQRQNYIGADFTTRFIVGYDIPFSLTVGTARGLAGANNKVYVEFALGDFHSTLSKLPAAVSNLQ
jgi:hypothetical protein